jgi:hypothetical protein
MENTGNSWTFLAPPSRHELIVGILNKITAAAFLLSIAINAREVFEAKELANLAGHHLQSSVRAVLTHAA